MDVERPIFIVGPHRSGTTLLYRTLARHPDLSYFTRADRRFRWFPPLADLAIWREDDPKPVEAQGIWDRVRRGDDDHLGASAARDVDREWYRRLVARTVVHRGGRRFVAKYPRLSLRTGWLDAVFPDAFFVHMARDWRAVVNSTVDRKDKRHNHGGGWFGVRPTGWRDWESEPHDLQATRTFVAVTRELERAAPEFGDRWIHVEYAELCERPLDVVRNLLERVGLSWTPEFEGLLREQRFANANAKWRSAISERRVDELREIEPPLLRRYEDEARDPADSAR
jgi:hypothetical protein